MKGSIWAAGLVAAPILGLCLHLSAHATGVVYNKPRVPVSPEEAPGFVPTPMGADANDGIEFDPYAADADATYDAWVNDSATDNTGYLAEDTLVPQYVGNCYQITCPVYAYVSIRNQTLTLYLNGALANTWPVSTGRGNRTPPMNQHPQGPAYKGRHDSSLYPSGYGYKGLGNMPYAVMIKPKYGIHGTPMIAKLGRKDSHGCIRLHPNNANYFSQQVRSVGLGNTWITVQ